jgi:hypothetical protein
MNMLRLKPMVAVITVMVSALLLIALAAPAAAQSEACVHLQVGSGYAATMQINFEGGVIGASPSFAVGQTQCLPLSAVADGTNYSVQVNALLGESVVCTPQNITRCALIPIAITYNASGTTLNVHCDSPTAGSSATQ